MLMRFTCFAAFSLLLLLESHSAFHSLAATSPSSAPTAAATMASKTVLITGSTRGIGLEFAKHYVQAGWKVIGATRAGSNTGKLEALGAQVVAIDTCDEATMLQAAKELEGVPIDLLINNAGIFEAADLVSTTKESLLKQFEVNAVGPFLVTRALLANLKLAQGATVAHVSSIMASISNNKDGGLYGYRTSKAALNMVNSSLAIDLKNDNITAVVLHPGYVATDLTGGLGDVHADESVAGMTGVLDKITMADSGKFFHFKGHTIEW